MPEILTFHCLADVDASFDRSSRVWRACEALFDAGAPWVRVRLDAAKSGGAIVPGEPAFAIECLWERSVDPV